MPFSIRRLLVSSLLGGLIALAASGSVLSAAQGQQQSMWWRSQEIITALSLTADQSARIDKIFKTTRPDLRQEFEELDRLEAKLNRLIEGGTSDEAALARQIDRVETARASANKTRSLMLWRMRQVLTPDQRERLKALQARNDRDRRSNGDQNRRQDRPETPRQPPSDTGAAQDGQRSPNF